MGGDETMALKADETEQVAQAIEQTTHIMFIYVEAFAMFVGVVVLAFILWKVYTDPTVPTVVKNRVLFGMLTFGLVVFMMREFGAKMDNQLIAFALGHVFGSVTSIVMFLYDKDKAQDNTNGPQQE